MNNTWWVKPDDLDDRQKAVIDLPLTTSHLIVGPPGSGKTNLLLLRASQMVRSGKPNILIVVFTRTLREFVATGGTQYAFGVDKIQTLNSWALRFLRDYGIKPIKDTDFNKQRRSLVTQIKDAMAQQQLSGIYDAIVLDEAQDYQPDELDVFFKLGKVVFAAADSRQKIYVTDQTQGPALDTRFSGNHYTLKHHYRNGDKVCLVADELAKVWGDFEPLMPTSQYDEKKNPSSVVVKQCSDMTAQVAVLVDSLQLQMKAYPDEHLGVLCPSRPVLKAVWQQLRTSAVGGHAILQSAEEGYEEFDPGKPICVCSIHGAKGLEFRTVHILDADNMKKSSLNRNIAYMAVTRAKTSLALYFSKELPGYIDSALSVIRPGVPQAKLNQLFGGD
jgi:superfamily I DNA and RNA helicase